MMNTLEVVANGTLYRVIVNDDPLYFETQGEAVAEARKQVLQGDGIDSLDVQHLENGLHGVEWYTVETVTQEDMTQTTREIIWECLLHELGGGEGMNVAQALIASARRLGRSEAEAMAVYDWL